MLITQKRHFTRSKFYRQLKISLNHLTEFFKHLLQIILRHPFKSIIAIILSVTMLGILNSPITKVQIIFIKPKLLNNQDANYYKNLVKGKPFFISSNHLLSSTLLKNDPRIQQAIISKKYLGEIKVTIIEKQYVAKFNLNKKYYVLTSQQDIIPVIKQQYKKLDVPIITGITNHNIQILKDKICEITTQLNIAFTNNHIPIKILGITPITDKWHIPTIKYTCESRYKNVKSFTILFSPQKPTKVQLQYLITFLIGAKQQHLKYSIIDLRFDRVIIK